MATTPKRMVRPKAPPAPPAPTTTEAPKPAPAPEPVKAEEKPVAQTQAPKEQYPAIQVRPKNPFPIYIYRQKVTAHPGAVTLVRRDPWVDAQLSAGILEEVS